MRQQQQAEDVVDEKVHPHSTVPILSFASMYNLTASAASSCGASYVFTSSVNPRRKARREKKKASRVLSKMDPSVDPCDDFYQYACGSFQRTTNIPDDKALVDSKSVLKDELMENLRNAIEDEDSTAGVPRNLQLARDLYNGCTNRRLIEHRGVEPLQRILREQLGGWPVVDGDSWDEAGFHWLQSIYDFRRAGVKDDFFLELIVYTDFQNTTHYVIYLDEPSLVLETEYLRKGLSDKLVNAYYQYQVDLAVLLGAEQARAERELKESLEFEIAMAHIMLTKEDRRKWTQMYNPMSVDRLQREFPFVPWLEFLQTLLPPGVTISSHEVVVVLAPTYLKKLQALLSRTPKRVVANYALWRAAEDCVPFMNVELRERQLSFLSAVRGNREREFRWKECLDTAMKRMDLSMSCMYVRKFFSEEAKMAAFEMVEDVRREFLRILQEAPWMDAATRKKAVEKAQSIGALVGYTDDLLDDSRLDRFYQGLEVDPALYLESQLNVTRFLYDFFYSRLRLTTSETAWIAHGNMIGVIARYNLAENSVVVPAGILQGDFFNADRPKYMNYGAIGFEIGYVLTHGFDDEGRQFDKNGNLGDWWDPVTREKYLKKAECIISQAGNFTDEQTGMHLNGVNTQGFNTAANGAIKEAYRAYLSLEDRAGRPEPRLPSLDHLSPRQMFWLAFAQTRCSKMRTERLRQRLTAEQTPSDRFRVLGPLTNRPEFAEDFGCPRGSRMNPVLKCDVW